MVKPNYKLLVAVDFLNWYNTDSPDNPPEDRPHYLKYGDIVRVIRRNGKSEWLLGTLDNRVNTIVPDEIAEAMRRAYLRRSK